MGVKRWLATIIIVIMVGIFSAWHYDFIKIGFAPSLGTFLLAILGVGAFLLSAGAVLPKDGRTGLTTMAIGGGLLVLSVLSAVTISFE